MKNNLTLPIVLICAAIVAVFVMNKTPERADDKKPPKPAPISDQSEAYVAAQKGGRAVLLRMAETLEEANEKEFDGEDFEARRLAEKEWMKPLSKTRRDKALKALNTLFDESESEDDFDQAKADAAQAFRDMAELFPK